MEIITTLVSCDDSGAVLINNYPGRPPDVRSGALRTICGPELPLERLPILHYWEPHSEKVSQPAASRVG